MQCFQDNLWNIVLSTVGSLLATLLVALHIPGTLKYIFIRVFGFLPVGDKTSNIKGEWHASYTNELDPSIGVVLAPIHIYQFHNYIVGRGGGAGSKVKISGSIVAKCYFYGTYKDEHDGKQFYGTFQVYVSPATGNNDGYPIKMSGRWIGFDDKQIDKINYGNWNWDKKPKAAPARLG